MRDIAKEYREKRAEVAKQIDEIKFISIKLKEAQERLEVLNSQREEITTDFLLDVSIQHMGAEEND